MRRSAVGILVVGVLVAACAGPSTAPEETAVVGVGALTVETFPDFGNPHLTDADVQAILAGTSSFAYDTFPATSGPHAPGYAPCGVYREEIPEIFTVHSMEHGAVVIHVAPTVPEDERAVVEDLARDLGSHVIVTPRSLLDSPVVVTAWTVMARLSAVDVDAIRSFWQEHARQGPERAACPFEVDQAAG